MGEFARTLQSAVRDRLAERATGYEWREEYGLDGTPVDVVGVGTDTLVAVELEVRRADPANNTVKLLRHLDAGVLDRYERVVVCQVFSAYYDLAAGGVSTKRENATFVGGLAERADDRVAFRDVSLPVDPPKRGGDPPDGWRAGVDEAVGAVIDAVDGARRVDDGAKSSNDGRR